MKARLKPKGRAITGSADGLSVDLLANRFYGHSGLPQAADSIAYDPIQKLLAVRHPDYLCASAPILI